MATWHGPNGITVEPITLNDRPVLRVTQTINGRQYLLQYCTSIRQVTQHVDLADLVEVVPLPRRDRVA